MNRPNPTDSARQMHADLARLQAAIVYGQPHGAVEDIAAQLAHEAARLAGGEYRPEYNGHPNRETWNTSLWIGNDPDSDEEAAQIVRDALSAIPEHWKNEPTPYEPDIAPAVKYGQIAAAADALQEWWENAAREQAGWDEGETHAGPVSDAWTYALAVTDWYSIAEGYAEGME